MLWNENTINCIKMATLKDTDALKGEIRIFQGGESGFVAESQN